MDEELTMHELEIVALALEKRAEDLKERQRRGDRQAGQLATTHKDLALKVWRIYHTYIYDEPVAQ